MSTSAGASGGRKAGRVRSTRRTDRDEGRDPETTRLGVELHVTIERPYRPPTRELRGRRVAPSLAASLTGVVVAVLALTATVAAYLQLRWAYAPLVLVTLVVVLRLMAVRVGAWITRIDGERRKR